MIIYYHNRKTKKPSSNVENKFFNEKLRHIRQRERILPAEYHCNQFSGLAVMLKELGIKKILKNAFVK